MNDDDDHGSERQRRLQVLTPTAAEIVEAMGHAQRVKQREDEARARDVLSIELFGRDGTGGRFGDMEKAVKEHAGQIAVLTEFKTRLVIYGSLLVTGGGVIAALAFKAIDHWLK